MSAIRRHFVQGLLGFVSLGFLWPRQAKGQAGGSCAGYVTDPQGNAVKNLVVEIIEPNGRISTGNTIGDGSYKLAVPLSGPYLIQFREPQGNTRLLDVRELTAGTNQVLSVTIDPQRKTFSANYSALQAVEALLALMVADRDGATTRALLEKIPLAQLRAIVDLVMRELNRSEPTERQRQFLAEKAATIQKLLNLLG